MFFIGLLLPLPIGRYLIRKARADLPLSLLGLASLPVLVWAASLGAKIGPCKVDGCMSSAEHSRLVFAIVAVVILLVAFGVLAVHQRMAGGGLLVVAELVGAFSIARVDTAVVVTLLMIAAAAAGYLVVQYTLAREATQVPDFPPA
jgi:hypothetical protein